MFQKPKTLEDFGAVFEPQEAVEPILEKRLRQVFLAWLTEIWAAPQLLEVGIKPRMRALFGGPPGTGKTTLAHHLAARLGMKMLLVGPEKVNSKWVGASAQNIGEMFDLVDVLSGNEEPVVLFFDEFDSVAASRMHGEAGSQVGKQDHNLMINTLLARMDRHEGIVIGASNFPESIDAAIWRRFELHVTLPLPKHRERERIIERYLAPFVLAGDELAGLADAFETASPSLMRQFCEAIKRNIVVGPLAGWTMAKKATMERILDSVVPHPDLGLPRLWAHRGDDIAIQNLQWPLSKEKRAPLKKAKGSNIVTLVAPGSETNKSRGEAKDRAGE